MTPKGQDLVDLAMTRQGQRYVLGTLVRLSAPDWSGPWDCAEFISWACYHAYGITIGVRPPDVNKGESYSGWWYEDALKAGTIDVRTAIGTPGAILIRNPADSGVKVGHVAISRGDNSTIEAHSAKKGVTVVPGANTRQWSCGMLIPGVRYAEAAAVPKPRLPADLLRVTSPSIQGDKVIAVQKALITKGVNPGPVDGVYGPSTAAAVAAFQAQEGIVVDGVVGPETWKHLGL
ncbi:MAG: peptidoglycan-binding protein [Gemmatimonadota bacterium]|jgi:hypothetical protein|nr:peptidoglycan-binding protein [Gemmatimonadota bacterium]